MRYFTFSLVLLASLVAQNASASVFTWDITPPNNGDLFIKLFNWEPDPAVVAGGGDLFGVGLITTINKGATTYWSNVPPNRELTMVFRDYKYNAASTPTDFFFTGGVIDVYFSDTPDIGPEPFQQGTNADPDPTDVFSNGTLMMTLVGHAGLTGGYTLTTEFVGSPSGRGYLDVVPGSGQLADFFDTNSFATEIAGDFADFTIDVTLQAAEGVTPGDGNYPIFSSDPIHGRFRAIPEPTALFIWGAIVGLAAAASKRGRR